MSLKVLLISVLLWNSIVPHAQAKTDTPTQRGCMMLRSWQRTENINGGMDRRLADKIWSAAVRKCKEKNPQKVARYVPPGRNGAPQGTWGGGTRKFEEVPSEC
jgi:hypothetical protein